MHSADDYYHAAFVYQHGDKSDDYLKAHVLATVAVARGKPEAKWIVAATLDRYLMAIGQSQVLGTQYKVPTGGSATQEPYNRALISDALRAAMGVPAIKSQNDRLVQMGGTPPAAKP